MTEENRLRLARRQTLLKMAAAGAFGAGGILGLVQKALAFGPRQGIWSMKGSVTIDGAPASVGQLVKPGQTVATGAGSEAVYVVGADAFMQRDNSVLGFEGNLAVSALRYLSGKVLSVFGKGGKQLHTPTASIGIRGTGCYIEADPALTYFCLCYGVADVVPHGEPGNTRTVTTQHHEHPLYIGDQPGQLMMLPAPVINHTDFELILLEQLVGRIPPFATKKMPASSGYSY